MLPSPNARGFSACTVPGSRIYPKDTVVKNVCSDMHGVSVIIAGLSRRRFGAALGSASLIGSTLARPLTSYTRAGAPAIARSSTAEYLAAARPRSVGTAARKTSPCRTVIQHVVRQRHSSPGKGARGVYRASQHPVSTPMPLVSPAEALADRVTSTSNLVSITEQTPRSHSLRRLDSSL